jgi:hypothetical protein
VRAIGNNIACDHIERFAGTAIRKFGHFRRSS